jgi:serine/threonine protein kinase
MGEVYLARRRDSVWRVALKVLHPQANSQEPSFRERLRVEAELAQRVQGRFTAPIVEADPDADPPWMATQYLPGRTLDEVFDEAPLDFAELAELGAGLAEVLSSFHADRLVHGDLKPSNVIMAADGPRVIDFGIARALDGLSGGRSNGSLSGTAAYMSPEHASGQVTQASDVFSLGSILVHAATGRPPFGTSPPFAVLQRIVRDDPDLAGVTNPRLSRLFAACLNKSAASRTIPEQIRRECMALVPGGSSIEDIGA